MENGNFFKAFTLCMFLCFATPINSMNHSSTASTSWITRAWNAAKSGVRTIINSVSGTKTTPETEPQQQGKKCQDVILILDPSNHEKIDRKSIALGFKLISALNEQTAPIITTPDLINNFCSWKKNYGPLLNQVKKEVLSTKNPQSAKKKALALLTQTGENAQQFDEALFIPLSLTELNDSDWYCYVDKKTNMVLLIPKKYIAQFTQQTTSSIAEKIKACGFNTAELEQITSLSTEALREYLETDRNITTTNIVNGITSMFVSDSTTTTSWNIYVTGHGYTSLGNDPRSAQVAGLRFNDFSRLLNFFDSKINTSFLHYSTCFAGGYNQTAVNEVLTDLKISYIVSAEGINESVTYGFLPHFKPNKDKTMVILADNKFTNFFGNLENFFGNPAAFIATKTKLPTLKKDPLATIVSCLVDPQTIPQNQPFIRIPSVGVFNALTVDKKVKILTNTTTKAYEFEGKTIDLTDPEIKTLVLYPTFISVPLSLNDDTAVVSPTPHTMTNKYHNSRHIFTKIKTTSNLNMFLYNAMHSNNSYATITFVIKELQATSSIIKDLIIQINGSLSSDIRGLDKEFTVFFNYNNKPYQYHSGIIRKDFISPDNLFSLFNVPMTSPVSPPASPATPEQIKTFTAKVLRQYGTTNNEPMTLSEIIKQIENNIDTTTRVQKPGALKKTLLLKQLNGLEMAMSKEQLKKEQLWREKNKKTGVSAETIFKRRNNSLKKLADQIEQLGLPEQEQNSIQKRITNLTTQINKSLSL